MLPLGCAGATIFADPVRVGNGNFAVYGWQVLGRSPQLHEKGNMALT
ncbi:MAG: hypothetical protein ACFCA4_13435 [Cyanophyceae cyanobacterium]